MTAMRKANGPARPEGHNPGTPDRRKVIGKVLKWIGVVTAVLSLIFGLHQLYNLVHESRERHNHFEELLRTGKLQQEGQEFVYAWRTLEEADQLEKGTQEVRSAQESLALAWIEDGRLAAGDKSFEDIVGKVAPVLDRALLEAKGRRKADLLAHRGWAEFLRSRDGVSTKRPEEYYKRAVEEDPHNVYARAMLGYSALTHGGKVGEARKEFSMALATGRERAFVREFQLAGLRGLNTHEADWELIRVVNDMRKYNEEVEWDTRSRIWGIYISNFGAYSAGQQQLMAVLPPEEQLATFRWLFDGADFDQSQIWDREYCRAILQEAAGKSADALRTFVYVRSKMTGYTIPRIRNEVEAAVRRLSNQP